MAGKENIMGGFSALAASTLSTTVTSGMVQGVFDEIIALLPVIIPAAVGFIAIRKGISFLFGVLKSV